MKTARDIMTKEIITVAPTVTVTELAQILATHGISGAPVVDDGGDLIGVVTENDLIDQKKKIHIPTVVTILDSVFYLENPERVGKEMKKMAGVTVRDICSRKPVTVQEDTPIDEIATIMAEQRMHTLPVVSDGRLVGIIGKRDIIKTLIDNT